MLLIATDEAGYGPKLGPLVIVGTAWSIPAGIIGRDDLDELFQPLRTPLDCGGTTVVVDDSKAIYKPSVGLDALHAVVSASLRWCGCHGDCLAHVLSRLAESDIDSIVQTPWLASHCDRPFLGADETSKLLQSWRQAGIELLDVKARVITAESFNDACDHGGNKADLLSQSTLALVRTLIEANQRDETEVAVFCDRHGGRRYYAGVLQHVFPEAQLRVVSEAKQESQYRLTTEDSRIDVAFTVKGDSFTPVALSSMHAKYLRERMVESLNHFFAARHRGPLPLKPTAGYPVDADRFLRDIEPIIHAEGIELRELVRSR